MAQSSSVFELVGERYQAAVSQLALGRLAARAVVLATGGRSLPKSGSDGSGFELARALGHKIVHTVVLGREAHRALPDEIG